MVRLRALVSRERRVEVPALQLADGATNVPVAGVPTLLQRLCHRADKRVPVLRG